MKTFTVTGTHGEITVNAETGETIRQVTTCACENCEGRGYANIVKFDIEEWKRAYPGETPMTAGQIDILDLGYWTKGGAYEPPATDWRNEFRD